METVTIPKAECLKKHAKDVELVEQFRKGVEDLKEGRFRRVA